jgi:ferric iron reductase protein FhuF
VSPVAPSAALPGLRAAAGIGDFFDLAAGEPAGPGFRPLSVLGSDPDAVLTVAGRTRASLASRTGLPLDAVPLRVGASLAFLGLMARWLSPAVGALVLGGVVADLRPEQVLWQQRDDGRLRLALPDVAALSAGGSPADRTELLRSVLLDDGATPLVEAFAEHARLSRTVLWGNVASAVAGLIPVLARRAQAHKADALAVRNQLFAAAPLLGRGTFAVPSGAFRRQSCCLLYKVPGAGACGDCLLTR